MKYVKSIIALAMLIVITAVYVQSQNSVLSTGSWYKLSTSENGIYKIGYNDLQSFGIDPSTINPKTIRIFGNGNGMIPEDPEAFRYDDLQENAIVVYGEEDEVFDPGDYILFYGESPIIWKPTEWNQKVVYFEHTSNLYTDKVCYFLNFDIADGKRVEMQYSTLIPPTYTTNTFNEYFTHDVDMVNLLSSGKEWYGETFNETTQYSYNVQLPGWVVDEPVFISAVAAGRSNQSSQLNCNVNGQDAFNIVFPAVIFGSTNYARRIAGFSEVFPENSQAEVKFTFDKPNNTSIAWLDYFTFNYRRNLILAEDALLFRDYESEGNGNVAKFEIETPNAYLEIWNVTHPLDVKKVAFEYADGIASFTLETDSLLEFIAFNEQQYLSPVFEGSVANQNLHGLNPVNLLILSPSEFIDQAEQLALFRQSNDGLSALVVPPDLIYNEFSSGVQDVSAIRDFAKHMYEKDTVAGLKYLLLFGKGSYDYKDYLVNNTNFVPVWESEESLNIAQSYCTDDFYGNFKGLLPSSPQLGIARIPISNSVEGENVLLKLIKYDSFETTKGNWRNKISLIADDEDNNLHLDIAESLAEVSDTIDAAMNISKIYLDAYTQEVDTSGYPVYPEVNQLIKEQIANGVLLMLYTGHGGYQKLAHEAIFTPQDVEMLANDSYFPLMINASGDVNKFDDPEIFSLGEQMFLSDQKGMIGVFSPTGPTYASANAYLTKLILKMLLAEKDLRLGDIIRQVKSNPLISFSNQKYVYFGDPSMKLAIPELNIETQTINGIPAELFGDTLNPGMQVNLTGNITDLNGNPVLNFNGEITITVYDRPEIKTTLGNDPNSSITSFVTQESVIAEITTDVAAGEFNAVFTLPSTLDAAFGPIKVSYYAAGDVTDAQGQYSEIIVGGPYSAVEEHELYDLVKVYPTFSKDKVFFETADNIAGVKIEILDLTGKTMYAQKFGQLAAGHKEDLNISGYRNGIYFVKVSTDQGAFQFKIIKQ